MSQRVANSNVIAAGKAEIRLALENQQASGRSRLYSRNRVIGGGIVHNHDREIGVNALPQHSEAIQRISPAIPV